MLKRRLVLPLLLIVSALVLVACGSSNGDESQIEDAIETSATSTDPADCTKFNTKHFVEQTTQTEGTEAIKTCEKEASEKSGASSADSSNIEVDGSKATADVALSGGGLGGQEVEVALIKEDDQWKLNELTGFANFDQAKVVETLEKQFAKSSEISKSLAACITSSFEKAPAAKLEEALLSVSTAGFEELAGSCFEEES